MCTIAEMLRRVQSIDLVNIAGDIVSQHTDELADLNRKQLMAGKNNKGELLGPKHSENPFFKTPESAMRYAAWKKRITPETPFDIPNLFINGQFHGTISFRREAELLIADSSSPIAGDIESTYNNTALGLDTDSIETVKQDIIRSPLIHIIAETLGVNITS